jgi:hypothetical protein
LEYAPTTSAAEQHGHGNREPERSLATNKGHFTHETEGPGPLRLKISYWSKRAETIHIRNLATNKGHFTRKAEGPGPLQLKISHSSKRAETIHIRNLATNKGHFTCKAEGP